MICKLYVIPFTSMLILANSKSEAEEMFGNNPQFISDLNESDIVRKGEDYHLAKPYLGNSKVIVTPKLREVLGNVFHKYSN